MSTPRGRHGADQDPERTGELPAWGAEPPGGWGRPDPDVTWGAPAADDRRPDPDEVWGRPGPDRGWDRPDPDDGWGRADPDDGWGRREPDDGWGPPAAQPDRSPWGDPDTADPGRTVRSRHGAHRDDAPTAYADHSDYADAPADEEPWEDDGARFEPGDEPWAPRAVAAPSRGRRRSGGGSGSGRGLVLGVVAAVVVVAVVLVLLFWMPGWAVSRTLDKTALQNGVTQILTQNYGLKVDVVECPDDVAVSTGQEFSCQAVVDGEQVPVPGRVTSDDGDYQISRV